MNGGCLPNSIDSHCISKANNDMDMDCAVADSQLNGTANGVSNGISNGLHSHMNGGQNGFTNGVSHNGIHKDVLLSQDVSLNRVSVAGRKRGREVLDDYIGDWKRCRQGDISTPAGQFVTTEYTDNSPMESLEQPTFVTRGALNSMYLLPVSHYPETDDYFICRKYKNSPCI